MQTFFLFLLYFVVVLEASIVHSPTFFVLQKRLVPLVLKLLDEVIDLGALEKFAVRMLTIFPNLIRPALRRHIQLGVSALEAV